VVAEADRAGYGKAGGSPGNTKHGRRGGEQNLRSCASGQFPRALASIGPCCNDSENSGRSLLEPEKRETGGCSRDRPRMRSKGYSVVKRWFPCLILARCRKKKTKKPLCPKRREGTDAGGCLSRELLTVDDDFVLRNQVMAIDHNSIVNPPRGPTSSLVETRRRICVPTCLKSSPAILP
jgi:hypothetical protein